MFQGTTIDELINSVERAEQKAQRNDAQNRREETMLWSLRDFSRSTDLQELVEVA